jgi:P27 family predicted phage terminase small subunit
MGKRGPAKKPEVLESLHGNPGHRKNSGKLTYEQPPDVPNPPVWLGSIAKKEWKRLMPLVFNAGVYTEADFAAFAAYCHSYEQWVMAEKALAATKEDKNSLPKLIYSDKNTLKAVPYIAIANDAKKQMLAFAREFGLTPSSRANMSAVETEDAPISIMEFMRGA